MRKIIFTMVAAALAAAQACGASAAPLATITQGKLEGAALGESGAAFKGIPFAAPPVGALRWKAPQPPRPWPGVRPALSAGHSCMQIDGGWNHDAAADMSEDCLYLNVYTPQLQPKARLPVMVWIYGGAFSGGSGTQAIYDGAAIASRGVVLVTLNYRLNVFGFFSHPDMKGGLQANFGIADQIAALRWVKANIAAFGGDPGNVTIFGQSAGGMSVITLMTSPDARGLFAKAIVESGAILKMPLPSLAEARQRGQQFAGGESLAQLRATPAADLLARFSAQAARQPATPIAFGPAIDGRVIPAEPPQVFAGRQEAKVPLIIGNNAREGIGRPDDSQLQDEIKRGYGPRADEAIALYSGASGDPVLGSIANQFMTDVGFRCSTVVIAARHADAGAPTWEYQFEQSLPGLEQQGAQHSFELPYVFGNLPKPGEILGAAYTAADKALSDRMIGYWTNFARTGDPNGEGLPTWPKFESAGRSYARFDTRFAQHVEISRGLRQPQCALFERSLQP